MKAKYEIGSKLYLVEQKSNILTRQKIYMTDSDGVRWYRYEKHSHEFTLKEHTVVGALVMVMLGVIIDDGEYHNQYFVNDFEFNILEYEIDQEKPYNDCWFSDKTAAEEYMQRLTKEAEMFDRS